MIQIVLGTRAEAIKMAPIILALKRHCADYEIVGTGQHRVDEILSGFGVDDPVKYILQPPEKGSVSKASIVKGISFSVNVIGKIQKHTADKQPEWVLYHGDTMTTAATAVGTNILSGKQWKTGHIEAGLRSGSAWEPFPEEISRVIADRLSDALFAPTEWAADNLRREKINKKIIVTGNTSVDSIKIALKKAANLDNPWKDHIIVNVHRFENIKRKRRLHAIVDAVLAVAKISDGEVLWPVHSTTEKMLQKYGFWKKIEKSVLLTEPLPYFQFVKVLSQARAVLTDGGSIQEECVTLGTPALILRNKTERPEGLKTPYNYLVGTDRDKIVTTVRKILENPPRWEGKNPYGDGKAGKRIAKIILGKW